ncbi:MAG: hypothetical protein JRJ35_17240 [Deltaproteobacteria bacterium]|nr:hypothetical protein [Deltaproteobacteria bacterium]MBW1925200.1 hypothetical protein [Deltaproteobacteria bacterium]MBW1950880.1 hypothetical protein [Deltaproteobacteria bacterium]MBW2009447.1 hypothetical protein [Deltaproteobacteria bacterium]MBW2103854.1 hypothetical protein [Deltaproteobacteria bacterium]
MKEISISPKISKGELVRRLGARKGERLSRATKLKVAGLTEALSGFLRPVVHYETRPLARTTKSSIELEKGPIFRSRKIAKSLTGCTHVVCFIATIGQGLEARIRERFEANRLSEAYILDALGSVLVEDVARQFQEFIAKKCAMQGECVTLRFSPGYCDWPLEEQRKLFSLFHPSRLKVHLSKSCLMEPRKSISGIFGIAPRDDWQHHTPYNPCTECSAKTCSARRAPSAAMYAQ